MDSSKDVTNKSLSTNENNEKKKKRRVKLERETYVEYGEEYSTFYRKKISRWIKFKHDGRISRCVRPGYRSPRIRTPEV